MKTLFVDLLDKAQLPKLVPSAVFDPLRDSGVDVRLGRAVYWHNLKVGGVVQVGKLAEALSSIPCGELAFIDREDETLAKAQAGYEPALYELMLPFSMNDGMRTGAKLAQWSIDDVPMYFPVGDGTVWKSLLTATVAELLELEERWARHMMLSRMQGWVCVRGYDQYVGNTAIEDARDRLAMEWAARHLPDLARVLVVCQHRLGQWNEPLLTQWEFMSRARHAEDRLWLWSAGTQDAESHGLVPPGTAEAETRLCVEWLLDWDALPQP
jgi:hypothetical protein